MRPVKHLPRYTYSDYLLWEGDWEMIEGIPYAMSPSATGKHQWIASLLTTEIVIGIRTNHKDCSNCIVVQDVDWIIDDHNVVRPDLAVVCYPMSTFITAPPSLIVEIVSPSSGHRDRIIKHEIYEEQKVQYYIIVDSSSGTFVAYQLVSGKYKEYTGHTFTIHTGCDITIDLAAILASVTD